MHQSRNLTQSIASKFTLSGACYRTARRGRASFFPELVRRFSEILSHSLPVYPAGVRGVDLNFKVGVCVFVSLDGVLLVVTLLASPARIRFLSSGS